MRCTKCGMYNSETASFCHSCGGELALGPQFPEPAAGARQRRCVACGRSIIWDANVCPYCGKDYRFPPAQSYYPHTPDKTAKPVVAGILMIISGGITLLSPFTYGAFGFVGGLDNIFGMIMAVMVVAGAISVVGGILAIARKYFMLALLGGIAAFFGFWLLGLVALILIALSYGEFKS
ncbi:MAG TPA: zinc ribbon domain-containing protein [Thermoplasmata archaeon]